MNLQELKTPALLDHYRGAVSALARAQAKTPPMSVTDPMALKRLQRAADEAEVEVDRRIAW